MRDSFAQVGASFLPAASLDAAVRITLPPGNYTAQISGVGSTDGIVLVEVYEMNGASRLIIFPPGLEWSEATVS